MPARARSCTKFGLDQSTGAATAPRLRTPRRRRLAKALRAQRLPGRLANVRRLALQDWACANLMYHVQCFLSERDTVDLLMVAVGDPGVALKPWLDATAYAKAEGPFASTCMATHGCPVVSVASTPGRTGRGTPANVCGKQDGRTAPAREPMRSVTTKPAITHIPAAAPAAATCPSPTPVDPPRSPWPAPPSLPPPTSLQAQIPERRDVLCPGRAKGLARHICGGRRVARATCRGPRAHSQ